MKVYCVAKSRQFLKHVLSADVCHRSAAINEVQSTLGEDRRTYRTSCNGYHWSKTRPAGETDDIAVDALTQISNSIGTIEGHECTGLEISEQLCSRLSVRNVPYLEVPRSIFIANVRHRIGPTAAHARQIKQGILTREKVGRVLRLKLEFPDVVGDLTGCTKNCPGTPWRKTTLVLVHQPKLHHAVRQGPRLATQISPSLAVPFRQSWRVSPQVVDLTFEELKAAIAASTD